MAKWPKNGQMAKAFYFWQTVSKRPNGNPELDVRTNMLVGRQHKYAN